MNYANVAALIVPSRPDLMSVAEDASRLDGVLLTGSPSNVAPGRYGEVGEANDEAGGPFDRGRDEIAIQARFFVVRHRKCAWRHNNPKTRAMKKPRFATYSTGA